jgi:hypothetical protein
MRSMTTRTSGGGEYSAQPTDKVKPFSFSGPPHGVMIRVSQLLAYVKGPSG